MCFFGVKTVVSYVIVIRETIRGAAMERMEVLRLYDHHSDEVYRLAYALTVIIQISIIMALLMQPEFIRRLQAIHAIAQ